MSDIVDENEIDIEMNKYVYKDEAIQLIDFQNNKFELNPEALELISSIEEEIIIVAVVGKARTGKSYLMNLMLDNVGKNKGVNIILTISFKLIQKSHQVLKVYGSGVIIKNPLAAMPKFYS